MFWLTGSQQYKMMKNIRDTLAGRIGILELYSFSKNETDGEVFTNKLDFSLSCLLERHKMAKKNDIMECLNISGAAGCLTYYGQMPNKDRNISILILRRT